MKPLDMRLYITDGKECQGKRIYSRPYLNKNIWEALDYYARFLYHVREADLGDRDIICHNDGAMAEHVRSVHQRTSYASVPSRKRSDPAFF